MPQTFKWLMVEEWFTVLIGLMHVHTWIEINHKKKDPF